MWGVPFFVTFQESEASRVLARYHANNGNERDQIVVYEMAQIRHALRMDKEFGDMNPWRILVATPGNRRRLMIIITIGVFSQLRWDLLLQSHVSIYRFLTWSKKREWFGIILPERCFGRCWYYGFIYPGCDKLWLAGKFYSSKHLGIVADIIL
jgi:hypothetical protein